MEYRELGKSGIRVSRLCFGSLTVGPLQAALPVEEGADVIAYAISRGVNFLDTAQYYQNYAYIRRAMQMSGKYDLVISTKSYAYSRETAREAVEEARLALNRDYIDLFMMHEQESILTLRGHQEALDYYLEMKEKGIIRAVGASMHHIAAVEGVCTLFQEDSERRLDVIHPIYNINGLGIADPLRNYKPTEISCSDIRAENGKAGRDRMTAALKKAAALGIGIFSMKPIGGGNLISQIASAFDFVLDSPFVDAVAVGMQSRDEVDANVSYFETRTFPVNTQDKLAEKIRTIHIEEYCEGCGRCAQRCGQKALRIENGHAICDRTKCVLCGYCSAVCPLFAIKVV